MSGLLALAVAAAASTSAYLLTRHAAAGGELRPSGIPATISTTLANLMNLDALPHQEAPGFALTEQDGKAMALSDFRGKVVVLEFLDPAAPTSAPSSRGSSSTPTTTSGRWRAKSSSPG